MATYNHAFDTSINVTSAINNYTTGMTMGINTTGCTLVFVGIVVAGTTARAGTSPTVGGQSMTQIDINRVATETNCELWYYLDPVSGTSQNFVFPNTNTRTMDITIASFCANNPTKYKSVIDSFSGATATSSTPGSIQPINIVYDGTAVFQVHGCGSNTVPSAWSHNLLYRVDRGQYSDDTQYGLNLTSGINDFTWKFSNDDWCSCIAAFRSDLRKYHVDIS